MSDVVSPDEVRKLVGKRCLVRIGLVPSWAGTDRVFEVEILEVSPSGKYVKIKDLINNDVKWVESIDLIIIECLE